MVKNYILTDSYLVTTFQISRRSLVINFDILCLDLKTCLSKIVKIVSNQRKLKIEPSKLKYKKNSH